MNLRIEKIGLCAFSALYLCLMAFTCSWCLSVFIFSEISPVKGVALNQERDRLHKASSHCITVTHRLFFIFLFKSYISFVVASSDLMFLSPFEMNSRWTWDELEILPSEYKLTSTLTTFARSHADLIWCQPKMGCALFLQNNPLYFLSFFLLLCFFNSLCRVYRTYLNSQFANNFRMLIL